jgi:hypothetical protein
MPIAHQATLLPISTMIKDREEAIN